MDVLDLRDVCGVFDEWQNIWFDNILDDGYSLGREVIVKLPVGDFKYVRVDELNLAFDEYLRSWLIRGRCENFGWKFNLFVNVYDVLRTFVYSLSDLSVYVPVECYEDGLPLLVVMGSYVGMISPMVVFSNSQSVVDDEIAQDEGWWVLDEYEDEY